MTDSRTKTKLLPAAPPRPPFDSVEPREVTITRRLAIPPGRSSSAGVAIPSDRVSLPDLPATPAPRSRRAPLPGWVSIYVIFVSFFIVVGLFVAGLEWRLLGHF